MLFYLAQETIVGNNNCFFAEGSLSQNEKYPTVGKQIRKLDIIGNNVVFPVNAIIVGGITIGDNAVIGAGVIVIKDVPQDWVIDCTPASIRN
jgi:acetyltransferase-like isoleucine patch superfamily enzyme